MIKVVKVFGKRLVFRANTKIYHEGYGAFSILPSLDVWWDGLSIFAVGGSWLFFDWCVQLKEKGPE